MTENNKMINLARLYSLTDTSVDILNLIYKYGPLPRKAVSQIIKAPPDSRYGKSHHVNILTRTKAVFAKDGCVGVVSQNEPEYDIENNMTMIKLFSVLSELDKVSKVTFYDYGEYSNELIFKSDKGFYKLILAFSGEEETYNERYSYEYNNSDDDSKFEYIVVVNNDMQIKDIHFPGLFMYCKFSYSPSNWQVKWLKGRE